jgi:hypothetical protein
MQDFEYGLKIYSWFFEILIEHFSIQMALHFIHIDQKEL